MMTKKTNQLIRTLKPLKPLKPFKPFKPIESDRLVVNPTRYVSNYNKSITDRYTSNRSINRNSKNNTKTDVNILLIIVIVLGIIGVILVILHFEKDIFNTIPDTSNQPVASTGNEPEKFKQKEEVFFVKSDNGIKKDEAKQFCNGFGTDDNPAKLATYTQLLEYTNKGANWCEYGWIFDNSEGETGKEILGFYPNKDKTCSVSTNQPIAGPSALNKNEKLGVNCYGIKPDMDQEFKDIINQQKETEATAKEEKEQVEKEFSDRVKKSNIAPFNKDSNIWSANVPNDEYLKDPICDNLNNPC